MMMLTQRCQHSATHKETSAEVFFVSRSPFSLIPLPESPVNADHHRAW
jgi:hypothetical protein